MLIIMHDSYHLYHIIAINYTHCGDYTTDTDMLDNCVDQKVW